MVTTLRAAILPYKSSTFIPLELPIVKLKQDFIDGNYKERKCLVFNGEHGIEPLFYLEERFHKVVTNIMWTTGLELYDGFEDILIDTALTNWEDLTALLMNVQKSLANFEQSMGSRGSQ